MSVSGSSEISETAVELRCTSKTTSPLRETPAEERLLWFKSPQQPPKSVALVVHGLNVKPSKMNAIARSLNEEGHDVLRVGLSGHLGDEKEFKKVTRNIWLKDLHQAYCLARQAADEKKLPLHFIGYSLGALLNTDLMNTHPEAGVKYDRMVLFAPAIAIRSITRIVEALNVFGSDYVLFSMANKDYRANPGGTPVAAYNALFKGIEKISKSGIKQNNTPTLIIIDPDDELISFSGVKALMTENHLNSWKLMAISNFDSEIDEGKFHHFIIDEKSLGLFEWKYVQTAMLHHLAGKAFDPIAFRMSECGKTGVWKTPAKKHCVSDSDIDCDRSRNNCVPIPK
jgi:esterase/lipase